MKNFKELDALEIEQRFETFYVCKIKARDLLKLAFTDPIRYEDGSVRGNQRVLDEQIRVKQIKDFVEGQDAAFPNSIIISANFDEYGHNEDRIEYRWRYDSKAKQLVIPTETKLASIIDGQHRVFGFKSANPDAQDMDLVCSVYIDLPNALQAYLFATININQKPVDRSLAYVQFGFNADKEAPESWSPDKLAYTLHQKFNIEVDSPFYNHIKHAPQVDEVLLKKQKESKWLVSTATIIDGIQRLISSNPKKDKYELQKRSIADRSRGKVLHDDSSPLRELYLHSQDVVIYKIVFNFFKAAEEVFFTESEGSSITKTVGIQALFDVLRTVLLGDKEEDESFRTINLKEERFYILLSKADKVDFNDKFFQFSGVGRKNIKDTLLYSMGYISDPYKKEQMSSAEIISYNTKVKRVNELRTQLGLYPLHLLS